MLLVDQLGLIIEWFQGYNGTELKLDCCLWGVRIPQCYCTVSTQLMTHIVFLYIDF